MLYNYFWALASQIGRIFVQVALFILLARGMGVVNFGFYVAIFSLSQIIYPFIGCGSHNILVKYVARNKSNLEKYWTVPLVTTFITGLCATVVFSIIASFLYNKNLSLLLFFFATEFLSYRVMEVGIHGWQGLGDIKSGALIYNLLGVVRLFLASVVFLLDVDFITIWILGNFLATTFVAFFITLLFAVKEKLNFQNLKISRKNFYEGLFFSFSGVSQSINANADNLVISKTLSAQYLSIYAVICKINQMMLLPVLAVFQSLYADYFKKGDKGLYEALKISRKIAPFFLLYVIVSYIGVISISKLIPLILGEDYSVAVDYVYIVALVPLIQYIGMLFSEPLTGSGYQKERALIQVFICLESIILNFFLVSRFLLWGAVYALVATELTLTLIMIIFCIHRIRKEAKL